MQWHVDVTQNVWISQLLANFLNFNMVELDSSLAYKMTSSLEFSFSCFCVHIMEPWAPSVGGWKLQVWFTAVMSRLCRSVCVDGRGGEEVGKFPSPVGRHFDHPHRTHTHEHTRSPTLDCVFSLLKVFYINWWEVGTSGGNTHDFWRWTYFIRWHRIRAECLTAPQVAKHRWIQL